MSTVVPQAHEHRVQFYDSEAFLIRAGVEFIETARRDGYAVVVFAARAHLAALQLLLHQHVDAVPDGASEDCLFFDANETLAHVMDHGSPDPQRFDASVGDLVRRLSQDGRRPVGIFSELVGILHGTGDADAAMRLEQLWDALVRREPVRLLCSYPMSAFAHSGATEGFRRVCDAHTQVNPVERLWDIRELGELYRTVALLQQRADALEQAVRCRNDDPWAQAAHDKRLAALASASAELEKLASQDALTGLSNRRIFNDRLVHAVERAIRNRSSLALIFIDVDDFKSINDTYGHAAGDHLLKQVAARLSLCARAADTVSRWGGDEFSVIAEESDADHAASLMQRIAAAMAAPFDIRGKLLTVSVSAGRCLFPDEASDIESLMHNADVAMYQAKRDGKVAVATSRALQS